MIDGAAGDTPTFNNRDVDAADAFGPLAPGAYVGAIEPGAFAECFTHGKNRHGSLGLRLDIDDRRQRVVRCSFLLESETTLGVTARDAQMLAQWARLVDAPAAGDWIGVVKNLWIGQRRLSVDLSFNARPAEHGRGYVLLKVNVSF